MLAKYPPVMSCFLQYIQTINVNKWDIFDVFQGIQFLPLDKYIYLKVHCFINQVETAFRYMGVH